MRTSKMRLIVMGLCAVLMTAVLSLRIARGQSENSKGSAGAKLIAARTTEDANGSDVAATLKTAAEALGLARWSGVGGQRLPEVDVVNTMEVLGSGTIYRPGPSSKPGEPSSAFKAEIHATLGYNPPAMRIEMTCTRLDGPAGGASSPEHTIEVVRDGYAWNESEVGAGLVAGKGTATPAMAAVKNRLLQLWILPYGVIKAAIAAGDKTKMSTEKGATILTFPLSGELSGVTVKATLDAQHEVAKVETHADNPALMALNTETDYSDYADHGEILTDVKSPGHIVRRQNGHPLLDLQIKMWDANNPYLVFPVPENVKKAAER